MNVAAAPSSAQLNEAIDRYHDVLTAYVDKGGEDHLALLDRMVQRGAVFAGRPILADPALLELMALTDRSDFHPRRHSLRRLTLAGKTTTR